MALIEFLRSPTGRAVRVVVGLALISYGSTLQSLLGLVLMMVGMVPAVTGFVDMCLMFLLCDAHRGGSHV
jgi:hypothetical protein